MFIRDFRGFYHLNLPLESTHVENSFGLIFIKTVSHLLHRLYSIKCNLSDYSIAVVLQWYFSVWSPVKYSFLQTKFEMKKSATVFIDSLYLPRHSVQNFPLKLGSFVSITSNWIMQQRTIIITA